MLPKPQQSPQLNFLQPGLKEQLSAKHPLYILAGVVNWSMFDENFKKHYRDIDFMSVPQYLKRSLASVIYIKLKLVVKPGLIISSSTPIHLLLLIISIFNI